MPQPSSTLRVASAAAALLLMCQLQYNRLGGEVVLEWTINAEGGVVGDALTCSTIDNRGVESCLQRVVRRWRFKPCKGGDCQVSQTVLFHNMVHDETRSCLNKPGS